MMTGSRMCLMIGLSVICIEYKMGLRNFIIKGLNNNTFSLEHSSKCSLDLNYLFGSMIMLKDDAYCNCYYGSLLD